MFSPKTCNFFVPFAQKDARFRKSADRQAASRTCQNRQEKNLREMKA
jgi:hypothetical protein